MNFAPIGDLGKDQPPIPSMKNQFHTNNKNLKPIGENATEKSIAQKRSKSDWGKRPRNGDEAPPNIKHFVQIWPNFQLKAPT